MYYYYYICITEMSCCLRFISFTFILLAKVKPTFYCSVMSEVSDPHGQYQQPDCADSAALWNSVPAPSWDTTEYASGASSNALVRHNFSILAISIDLLPIKWPMLSLCLFYLMSLGLVLYRAGSQKGTQRLCWDWWICVLFCAYTPAPILVLQL